MNLLEQLGSFYLGRRYDLPSKKVLPEPILYDAKDLTTHAVCVGMTGSGKTGLGIALLEEAALDGIPIIAIDPKGDLANLMLTFPELRAQDFRPWVDENLALREGRTVDEQAAWLAQLWKKGLADWDQDADRVRRFEAAAERIVFTPGSRAGQPLAILRGLAAPPAAVADDDEARRDRIGGAVGGLLGLLGLPADPVRSRQHILLSSILDHAWTQGQDLDLPTLIQRIQQPPFNKVGVFDLESFFGADDRFELAMLLNNLLASPGFETWAEGTPLHVPTLLRAPDGRPRLSILSIAHLSDNERMFFVTTLLNEVVAWMRTQKGSSSLRAILYMDEVFGYLPPTAEPPSKRPLMLLLKQARAFGLGIVLATQNPVDLDYKALSNMGTWFLGRLQTARDKERLLEGLEGVTTGASFDRAAMDRMLSSLESRVFLLHNVHEDEPVLMQTRWVLSYLAGPVTREQLKLLPRPALPEMPGLAPSSPALAQPETRTTATAPPALAPDVPQRFVAARRSPADGETLLYRAVVAGKTTLHYVDAKTGLDEWDECVMAAPLEASDANIWREASELSSAAHQWQPQPDAGAAFADISGSSPTAASLRRWQKMLATELYRTRPLVVRSYRPLKLFSKPGETESEFAGRVREAVREQRDLAVEKLRQQYAPKLARLEERIRTQEHRVDQEQSQLSQQKMGTAISVGATVLGALFGRKLASTGTVGRASTAMRSAGRISKEKEDIARAGEKLEVLQAQLQELTAELEERLSELHDQAQAETFDLDQVEVAPRKSDLAVDELVVLWLPWIVDSEGAATEAF